MASTASHAITGDSAEATSQAQGRLIEVKNPSTAEVIGSVPRSSRAEVDRAVREAKRAFQSWSKVPVVERARFFLRFAERLERHHEELARLVCRENGKTLADAQGEVRRAIEVAEFACGMPSLMMGEALQDVARDIDSETIRQPLGVCVGITPFNFPAMVPLWMYPIAIAAGNTFVLKPSPQTPLSQVRIAELFYECGFAPGVLNLVHGDREVVEALIEHPDTAAISFVGSSAVARQIHRLASEHHKRVQALGGGKNYMIVMPDAVNEKTVDNVASSAFGGAGQRCLAGSAVVAVGDAGDRLVAELKSWCEKLSLGPADEEGTGMGPVISEMAKQRVVRYIEEGAKGGAQLVVDGRTAKVPNSRGWFIGPTIFDHVDPDSSIAREEIFGPLLSVLRAPTLEAALELANRPVYGNASSIFTRSGAAARTFVSRIRAGMVGVNVGVAAPMAFFPFGGVKDSLFGDIRIQGKEGVAFYTQLKVSITRWQ